MNRPSLFKRLTALLALFLAAASVPAAERVEEHMLAMRDGVKLATTVAFPEDGDGPWPAVLSRTPYNKDGLRGGMNLFLKNGFAIVMQDCRGRFKSEGSYVPFKTDIEDGYDTVEWVGTQSWCTGKVGMTGGSAVGITTNLAAAGAPPHLAAGFVLAAPSSWRGEVLWIGGVWSKSLVDGWMAAQNSTPVRLMWSRRQPNDSYFDWADMNRHWPKIQIPMYNAGGWFDIFTQGSIDNFAGLQERGGGNAKGNQKLIMAAVGHGPIDQSRWKKYPNGGDDLKLGEQLRWFNHWLKGEETGIMQEPPIRYFLMGDAEDSEAPGNKWMTADAWPPPSEPLSYYLQPGGGLKTTTPTTGVSRTTYAYDPKNPVKTQGGANLILPKGPLDQREIGQRADYLRFNSETLAEPLTVVGRLKAEIFVSSDAPDTDFFVSLVDVYPDGYEALIMQNGLRMRYRRGTGNEIPMNPKDIEVVDIDLWSTAYVFNKGHKIAVHVTSSCDPRFDPNPNTGKPLRADSETRVANNSLYCDASRPSRIILPMVKDLK